MVEPGDYWIIGLRNSDSGKMAYTVVEVVRTSAKELQCFLCGNEVEFPASEVDKWVQKIEMPKGEE